MPVHYSGGALMPDARHHAFTTTVVLDENSGLTETQLRNLFRQLSQPGTDHIRPAAQQHRYYRAYRYVAAGAGR